MITLENKNIPLFGLMVNQEEEVSVISNGHFYESSEGVDTIYKNTFHNLKEVKDWQIPDVLMSFEPLKGEEYFLVSCIHTDGDSYNSVQGLVKHIAVFKNEHIAEQCKAKILNHYELIRERYGLSTPEVIEPFDREWVFFQDDEHNNFKTPVLWNSCFEHLSNVNVAKLYLE